MCIRDSYSTRTVDIEYRFGFAGGDWGEIEGIANRTDFDLKTDTEHSGVDLSYFDQTKNERWVPYVIEPAAGWPRSRQRCCRCPGTRTCRRWRATWRPSCASPGTWSSTTPARSAGATAARTRSARRSASPWTSRRWRTRP